MKTKLFKFKRGTVVTVLGGSGFLGNYVVKELAKKGAIVKVASRHPQVASSLRVCGAVGQIGFMNCDAKDEKQLEKAIAGSDVVINLLGILFSNRLQSFENIHNKVAFNVSSLCFKHQVKRLIHVSALGVERSSIKSKYARTKLAGEKAIFNNFPSATVFRPSIIFGPEDNFTNLFNTLSKFSPVLPLIGGGTTQFQPIFVGDVAKVIVASIDTTTVPVCGKTFELGGPKVYSFKEIIELILKINRRRRLLIPIPFGLAKIKASFLELMPKPLFTRDQVELLKFDNIVFGKNGIDVFNIKPTHLETLLPTYIQ